MQITNTTASLKRNSAAEAAGLNRYKNESNANSEASSQGVFSGFSKIFSPLVSSTQTRPARNVATGTNRNSFKSQTSRSNGLSAYQQSSDSYNAEKASIMQSANMMKITYQGRNSMSSYLTGSVNSPINSSMLTSSLSSIMSEGIRQYGIMENGISSNFNILSQSASLINSVGSMNSNSASLYNFL